VIPSSKMTCALLLILLFPIPGVAQARTAGGEKHSDEHWLVRLNQELPLLGHRNWIAVVDSAYPLQTSVGIETLETDGEQLDVVRKVLSKVAQATHVRPVIFTDVELKSVPDSDAPGVSYYRDQLNRMLEQYDTSDRQSLPHEQLIAQLDDAGKAFHILVLKTRMTIPYTSVFIRLDCGYWTEEQEKKLRARMGAK
jgi:hypothetical protein